MKGLSSLVILSCVRLLVAWVPSVLTVTESIILSSRMILPAYIDYRLCKNHSKIDKMRRKSFTSDLENCFLFALIKISLTIRKLLNITFMFGIVFHLPCNMNVFVM